MLPHHVQSLTARLSRLETLEDHFSTDRMSALQPNQSAGEEQIAELLPIPLAISGTHLVMGVWGEGGEGEGAQTSLKKRSPFSSPPSPPALICW